MLLFDFYFIHCLNCFKMSEDSCLKSFCSPHFFGFSWRCNKLYDHCNANMSFPSCLCMLFAN